jgi:thioredoxin 1
MNATDSGFNPIYSQDEPTPEQVTNLTGNTLLEFGAPWCGHCLAAEPVLQEVLTAHTALPHIKIYDGKGKPLGRAFKVKLWPTLILLRDGKEVARLVRPTRAEEVRELIAQ